MGHIFISYSHKDTKYAHALADHLKSRGFDFWIDERLDYGSQWPYEIQKQLDSCDAFLVIMTPRSFASEWVQSEVQRAKRKLKPIFPLLLEGDEPWLSLESTQYFDVRGETLPDAKFFSALQRVMTVDPRSATFNRLPKPVIKTEPPQSNKRTGWIAALIGGVAIAVCACAATVGPLMRWASPEPSLTAPPVQPSADVQVSAPQTLATSTIFVPSPTSTATIAPTLTNVPPTATLPPTLTRTPSRTPTPPLAGQWYWNGDPGPVIYVEGNSLWVDMSAYGRPVATGTILDESTIEVTFSAGDTYIGKLVTPNRIEWSNGTVWEK